MEHQGESLLLTQVVSNVPKLPAKDMDGCPVVRFGVTNGTGSHVRDAEQAVKLAELSLQTCVRQRTQYGASIGDCLRPAAETVKGGEPKENPICAMLSVWG